jgi:predicted enzyme related to lactoylglutathione lyase
MTRDCEAAKAFYGNVFGYTYNKMDAAFTYFTIKRAGDGEVVAGIGELDASVAAEVPASWATYFLVENTDASAARAVELGASIVSPAFDTPFGRMAPLVGAQGETFSLIQAPTLD